MASKVASAVSVRLELSDGDWIDVKSQLNVREVLQTEVSGMSVLRDPDTDNVRLKVNEPADVATSRIVVWLLDWSILDQDGDKLPCDKDGVLRLTWPAYEEIKRTIERHARTSNGETAEPVPAPVPEPAPVPTPAQAQAQASVPANPT